MPPARAAPSRAISRAPIAQARHRRPPSSCCARIAYRPAMPAEISALIHHKQIRALRAASRRRAVNVGERRNHAPPRVGFIARRRSAPCAIERRRAARDSPAQSRPILSAKRRRGKRSWRKWRNGRQLESVISARRPAYLMRRQAGKAIGHHRHRYTAAARRRRQTNRHHARRACPVIVVCFAKAQTYSCGSLHLHGLSTSRHANRRAHHDLAKLHRRAGNASATIIRHRSRRACFNRPAERRRLPMLRARARNRRELGAARRLLLRVRRRRPGAAGAGEGHRRYSGAKMTEQRLRPAVARA